MEKDFGLTKQEFNILKKLDSAQKIQSFLDSLRINFEPDGDTCKSPRVILKTRQAHCIEAAVLAALALRIHNYKPLLVDLSALDEDEDHVIAVFKQHGFWGAISKSNHNMLRYRDPIYKSIRELVMSYFNEYYIDSGKKTLRSFSVPVNLSSLDHLNWATAENDLWEIPDLLIKAKHFNILSKKQQKNLRKADKFEIKIGKIKEYEKNLDSNKDFNRKKFKLFFLK